MDEPTAADGGAAPRRRLPYPAAPLVAVSVLGLDQLSKFVVARHVTPREAIDLLPFFALRWEENRGVSLNYLKASDDTGRWLLVAFTATLCALIAAWLWREKRRDHALALGLVLGGALGNIADRIRHGFVFDFADLHFGEFRPFLIFNLADAAIAVGVLLLLAMSLLSRSPKPD